MKKLSQTWRQKPKCNHKSLIRVVNDDVSLCTSTPNSEAQDGTPRRSERLAKSKNFQNKEQSYKHSSKISSGQCSLLMSSFGFEFDDDALAAVDKMEQEHARKELRPLLKPQMSLGITHKPQTQLPSQNSSRSNMSSVFTEKPASLESEKPNIDKESNKHSLSRQAIKLNSNDENYEATFPITCEQSSDDHSLDKQELSLQLLCKENSFQNMHRVALTQEKCELSSWGLPDSILEEYNKIGITTMFEWQAQCLCTGNVLNGGNLVYSAPTSAGKTMVAEILILKRILEIKCKALFILPFVSVAREKMFYLQRMFGEAGIKVDGYMGSLAPTKGFDSIDIAVCTIEKANGLVNRLMESGQLCDVGAIVVDEIHLIGDTSRGYLLELLLTKVLYMSQSNAERNVQIIGMSATLPNLDVLATWLCADLYYTKYRPVPLTEAFKVGPVIYDRSENVIRELSPSRMISGDDDHVLLLCQETVQEGNGVLVFCPTKSWCEKLAESIAKHFYSLECKGRSGSLNFDLLKDVFEQLRSCQVGVDHVLGKVLRYGVAYHHAGLTYDERDIIEAAFKQGVIKVVVATSTLSSGVNLPARRVIIRTPMFHGKLLDGLVYKQMSGRAGRKGVDSRGESILLCKTNERQKARSLFQDDLKPVKSCLVVKRNDEDEGNGIKRALLEVIAGGVATTPADVKRYAGCTLYVSSKTQGDSEHTKNIIESTVEYLEKNEFITLRKKEDGSLKTNSDSESYVPTQLGQATLASSLSPDEALVVFTDLRKARKCFVLENELHILYQVTPIYVQDTWPNLDWYQYLRLWERLPLHMKRVAELVGVEERFLSRAIHGHAPKRSDAQRHVFRVHKRFYVTLALHDLVHETPLDIVARRYGASRGMLQSLQSSAATFAGMVTVFCRKLGWNNLEILLAQFQNRLTFGVERELCDMIRISSLNAFRARVLYSAGYHTVAALAAASPSEVEKHLRNAMPFQSKKKSEGETEFERRKRMRAKCIWVNGGKALTEAEAAQAIVKEACAFLKEDALKLGISWQPTGPNGGEQDSENISKVVEIDKVKKGDGHNKSSKRNFKGTPKKKPHNGRSFKRKHTLSNSPKDCSRPKMKLNDRGASQVVNDSKECALKSPLTTKHGCKDNFYSDCLDNFKIRDDKTPPNRKTRNALPLEISADIAPRSPAKKVPLVKTTKFSFKQLEVQSTQVKPEEILCTTSELLDNDQKSESKNKMKDQEGFIEKKNTIEKASDCKSESCKATAVAFKLNVESLHTTTGKQFEFKDDSPELICESSNTTPVTKPCTRRASSSLLVPSPELSSEWLFPDSEELFPDSPVSCEGNFNTQIDKISELSGFEIVDTSMQDLGICEEVDGIKVESKFHLDVSENKSLVKDAEAKGGGIFDLVFTPDRIPDDKKRDILKAEDVCPPGTLDSSSKNSQHSPMNAEVSRGSPNSFSLKLSESSDDSTSESDLSTTTLAAVVALEEHKIVAKDNQGDDGGSKVDNAGSQGFQEVSRMSQGIAAAIEATDNELHHKVDTSSAGELRVAHESSLVTCFTKITCKSGGTADCSKPNFKSVGAADCTGQPDGAAGSHVEETLVKKTRITKHLRKPAFEIIDIAKDHNTLDRFVHDCKHNSFSFSVGVERRPCATSSIGRRFNIGCEHSSEEGKFDLMIEEESLAIVGIAVCWETDKVYFMSFEDHTQSCGQEEVSLAERLECLKSIMGVHEEGHLKTAFGMKEQYKLLSRACGAIIKGELQDPKIATWLLDPAAKEKKFVQMIEHFLPQKSHLLQDIHGNLGYSSLGQAIYTSLPARERSCLDAVFSSMLMDRLRHLLQDDGLWQAFRNIEMTAVSCLARMELNGFGFSNAECEKIKQILRGKLRALEQEAYKLAKHVFSLTSPEDVSRVLFLELKLPPNGNTEFSNSSGKIVKPTRGGRRKKVKYFSTSKDVLERLIPLHPLPKVLLEWRRVNSALTKIVFPVQKEHVKCGPPINMSRIFPTALTHTVTGRVTFVEPNLQNVPRDFDINLPSVISDTPPTPVIKGKAKPRECIFKSDLTSSSPGPQFSVSLRSAFVSVSNGILLAADYSQLELRLIAHLASDRKLASFLNAGGDAFKMIAGELFRVTQDQVSDEQRQRAKHVCYGIIYGIGAKALGQTLGVNENEAAVFVDAFKTRFTGVCAYLKKTVEECRCLGYVTTISKRRRYLPNIRVSNAAARSQAERQAVNTTVQGSAADLVKLAMSNIDRRLCEDFPDCWRTHRQKSDIGSGRQAVERERNFRGANLVLQLHDELLFEVAQQDFSKVVKIVKQEMEDAMKLSVQLPVKLKSGKSWGTMQPLEVV